MHSGADLPQFRADTLNQRSVSVPDGTDRVTVGGPWPVLHLETESREAWSDAVEPGLVLSEGGRTGRSDEADDARAGGGTPP
jgi:hypothetical protein